MKSCSRKILLSVFLALISIVVCLGLTACDFGGSDKLTNEGGFTVVGGNFEEGSVLETSLIDSESEDYYQAIALIASESYDATKPVYVFEISVKKDGTKVQPNGKVKVSVPISADLTGYDVLHIKDDEKIERLKVTYKNGIATFETNSFSIFVFVKKVSSGDGTTTKYTVKPYADTIIPDSSSGGAVRDKNGEYITFDTLNLAEGSECILNSHCYPNYYFLGWYEATEDYEATEKTFLSSETIYTFTVTKNINVLALYAYKTHAVKFTLDADGSGGFSYRNGKPTLTLVSSSEKGEKPNHKEVEVRYVQGDGEENTYSYYGFENNVDMHIVDSNNTTVEELDYSKVGKYTITYSHKRNPNINATLEVEVVDSAHRLYVSTKNDKRFYFGFNGYGRLTGPLDKIFPKGRLITLTAQPADNYAFLGWYEGDKLISTDLVYCFEMPDRDIMLHGEYAYTTKYIEFSGPYYDQGELLDDFGNKYIGSEKIYYIDDINVNLTVREKSSYEFLGWYDVTGGKSELLTEDKTLKLELDAESANMSVSSRFREKLKYIEFGSDTLSDERIVNGKIGFAIGDAPIDYNNFTVKAKGLAGSYGTLSASDYTIDGAVDFNTAGTYTVTYTYKYDTSIKTQIQILVIDSENAEFTFTKGYSYLDHEYDGKATFIALQDVKINGIPLYNFKSTSKIWDKLSYKWIDTATNKEVDTADVDVTINGTVVKDYGPENYKRNIGNEFCGPIKAGSYKFELAYDGTIVLTQESTISTQNYKKITTESEFKTNEGSMWLNFELYYYTIIGYADGKYYAMQMPSIGTDNVEAEAREISVDSNGNATVGDGNDFAFVYVRYFASDSQKRMEFLTGYYGSYIDYSSNSTVDGTTWGAPYIYRTGHTYIGDGKVCREYGNKESYGMSVTFDENGAVTIHSNSGSADGRLRLVKDGDKYVFTGVSSDTDTRESFDVFIYRTITNTNVQESNK